MFDYQAKIAGAFKEVDQDENHETPHFLVPIDRYVARDARCRHEHHSGSERLPWFGSAVWWMARWCNGSSGV